MRQVQMQTSAYVFAWNREGGPVIQPSFTRGALKHVINCATVAFKEIHSQPIPTCYKPWLVHKRLLKVSGMSRHTKSARKALKDYHCAQNWRLVLVLYFCGCDLWCCKHHPPNPYCRCIRGTFCVVRQCRNVVTGDSYSLDMYPDDAWDVKLALYMLELSVQKKTRQ